MFRFVPVRRTSVRRNGVDWPSSSRPPTSLCGHTYTPQRRKRRARAGARTSTRYYVLVLYSALASSQRERPVERERERERGVLEVIILSQNHEINSYVSCVGELKIVRKREGNDDKY